MPRPIPLLSLDWMASASSLGRWRGLLLALLSTVVLFYLGLMVVAAVITPRTLFPVPPVSYFDDDPDLFKLDLPSGERISVLHLARPDARYVLLYAHGNSVDLGRIRGRLEEYRQAGFSVLAFDYPGYGTSTGSPSEPGLHAATEAVYRFTVDELGFPPAFVLLYGLGIGGSPVARIAAREPVGGLVLENVAESAFQVVPILRILPWDHAEVRRWIDQIKAPILIIHGRDDDVVPIAHGEALLAATRAPKMFLFVDDAGHDDLIETAGETYWSALERFMFMVEALPPP